MYLCAKGVTQVEVWRNCSTWNSLGACGMVEKYGVNIRATPKKIFVSPGMFHVEHSAAQRWWIGLEEMFHVEHPLAACFVVESARL
jgi:hypothetical protein